MPLSKSTKDQIARIAVMALFAISLVALIIRSYYTFCWIDESFYLALVDRLYRGDVPFIDEWHPAQFFAPLLLPFYMLYIAATGGTDGVILFFRILYVVLSFAVSVFSYMALKKNFGRFIALCIALTYLFYVRGNILGMSYYSLCTTFFMLGLMFAWCCYQRIMNELGLGVPSTSRVILPLLAGASFALATICNPFVVVFVFLACLTGLIRAFILRRPRAFTPFAWGMAGCVLVACFYLLFVFQRIDPASIIGNLPNILNSHDENLTYSQRIPNFLSYLPISRVSFIGTWVLVIFLIFWRISGRGISRRFRICILLIDTVCLLAACMIAITVSTYPNRIFLAFVEFALPCFMLQEDLRFTLDAHPELHLFWIPGILLALIWQFSSNTQISGMLIGFMFACFGAFITVRNAVPKETEMAPDTFSEPAPFGLRCLCLGLIAAVALSTACIRIVNIYSDCSWEDMTATVQDGPAAGLHTSDQHLREYVGLRDIIAHINTDGGVWIEPMAPWGYLETPGGCAVVSAWNTFMDQHDADVYYGKLGHEYPQWIIITPDDLGKPVNFMNGEVKHFPALDMYYDYNAQLRQHLADSSDYGPIYSTEFGTLYKRAEHSFINQG